jgi:hypothetical protein
MDRISLHTNRELYQFIMSLAERHKDCSRSLQEYLRALLVLTRNFQNQHAIGLSDFAIILDTAFTSEPAKYDEAWEKIESIDGAKTFEGFERFICWQIVELRQMDRIGKLKDPMKSFGINSPRGARWYNFDPITYLECGTAGSFDGWEPDDDSGRKYVPGKVVTTNESGEFICVDPQELKKPTTPLPQISWEEFCNFLWAGQSYE